MLSGIKPLINPPINGFIRTISNAALVRLKNQPKKKLPYYASKLDPRKTLAPEKYRFVYPEFLPNPKMEWRHTIKERIERGDMLNRRVHIDIPEFYVGSIMAVVRSDRHAAGKTSRFVGICIDRDFCGLNAQFILRNVIDHQGCEVKYEMYDPTIQKIEVLRLEKRLDGKLFYLRDALPEYSTFDLDMDVEHLPDGVDVPVNPLKVILKPRPWLEHWERQKLQGVANMDQYLKEKLRRKIIMLDKPYEKYDLVKQYRETIPDEEQKEIYSEVYPTLHQLELQRQKMKRKRIFVKPTKLA